MAFQLRDEALERNSRDNISVMVPTPALSLFVWFAFFPTVATTIFPIRCNTQHSENSGRETR